jgi:hypothetical protein
MSYEGKHRTEALRAAESNSPRDERWDYTSAFAERFFGWLSQKPADEQKADPARKDQR